jgi:hypothetical protein
MPEEKYENSLTRIYKKFEADVAARKPNEPARKPKQGPTFPLLVVIMFLFCAVGLEEYARYKSKVECDELRAKLKEAEKAARTEPAKIEAAPPPIAAPIKRRARRRRPKQEPALSDGYGEGKRR